MPSLTCDSPVQGDGIMSYHCTLTRGHESVTGDQDDPQPCFAVESARSVRVWKAWVARDANRATKGVASSEEATINCPKCTEPAMRVTESGGLCENCGATAEIQQDLATVTQIGEQMLPGDGAVAAAAAADPSRDKEIREAAQSFASGLDDGCPGDEHDPAINPDCEMRPPIDVIRIAETLHVSREDVEGVVNGSITGLTVPTKQREGDQILPKAGVDCVQDVVISAMEESKRVGIERYGQPLMTFNGRKGMQDIVEEARDFFVYGTMLLREAEADRETLVLAVAQAIRVADGNHEMGAAALAEVAVDTIMGWVTTQRIAFEEGAE